MLWRKLNLSSIIEQLPIGVAVTRPDGCIDYANVPLHALLGERGGRLVGRELAAYRILPARRSGAAAKTARRNGRPWRGESRLLSGRGEPIHVLEAVYPLHGEGGALACLVHFFQDLRAQKRLAALRTLAYYDALTGLPNRNLFDDRLAQVIVAAERVRAGFALLYIDVDGFKSVNDNWGHAAGDRMLREATVRMARALRKSDTLARLGGDEFAAILGGTGVAADAAKVAHKLLDLCREHYHLDGGSARVTLSVGISLYPQDGLDAAALLRRADFAMYRAKALGRDRCCFAADAEPLSGAGQTPTCCAGTALRPRTGRA